MDSQLTRNINPNRHVTTIWWGLIWLVLWSSTVLLCTVNWIIFWLTKNAEFLDMSFAHILLSHNHTRHVPLLSVWATFKTPSKCLAVKNIQTQCLRFLYMILHFLTENDIFFHEFWRYSYNIVILTVIGAQLCVCTKQLAHSVSF